jgi:hypothetical protein
MARTKKAFPIPLFDSHWGNLKKARKKNTCPEPLLDSLRRKLENGKNKRKHVL